MRIAFIEPENKKKTKYNDFMDHIKSQYRCVGVEFRLGSVVFSAKTNIEAGPFAADITYWS